MRIFREWSCCCYRMWASLFLVVSMESGGAGSAPTTTPPPHCGMGRGGASREGRIIGGKEAFIQELPWLASIQRSESEEKVNTFHSDPVHICGGTIIGDSFIISAAHCFSHLDQDASLSVVVGSRRISGADKHNLEGSVEGVGQRIRVSRVVLHPLFDGGLQYMNDIALLELEQRLEWSSSIAPICLPSPGELFGRTAADSGSSRGSLVHAVASGWGRTWGTKDKLILNQSRSQPELDFELEYAAHSPTLKAVNLRILPNSECEEFYSRSWSPITLAESQLCAGDVGGSWEEDTASGDSGGPLSIYSKDGRWTIAGITSFGTPYRAPGVYCRISSYLDWIQSIIAKVAE